MCEHCEHHRDRGYSGEGRGSRGGCGCGCSECECEGHGHAHDQTKAEKITELESRLGELKTELRAIEEHLNDLRK